MKVNAKEGLNRLSILLGILGALLACLSSQRDATNLWRQSAAHRKFESIMSSPSMRKIASAERKAVPPPGLTGDRLGDLWEWAAITTTTYLPINVGEIDGATVDQNGRVLSIKLSTGEFIERTAAPPFTSYLALLLYPILGFLFPWGAVRLVTWVASGFFDKAL
jgi:hypothetical protein